MLGRAEPSSLATSHQRLRGFLTEATAPALRVLTLLRARPNDPLVSRRAEKDNAARRVRRRCGSDIPARRACSFVGMGYAQLLRGPLDSMNAERGRALRCLVVNAIADSVRLAGV
jgi:hypothetical protein